MVQQVKTQEQLDAVFAAGKPVVIDFTATWCGPCQRIAPIYAKWADEVSEVSFLKIDVDDAKELAQKFKIEAMPTFVFFDKDKKETSRVRGANMDAITAALSAASGKKVTVPEAPTRVKHVKNQAELDAIFALKKPVIIDFTAAWCGPCKQVAPIFADISNQVPVMEFVKIDVDEAKDLAQKFKISAMPTFIIMKDATTEKKRIQGADIRAIVSAIEEIMNAPEEVDEATLAAVKHVKTADELKALFAGGKPVILDFTASWCPPCKRIAPKYAQLAKETEAMVFAKIDVDEAKELAKKFGIEAMPTFIVLKDEATEVERVEGADLDGIKAAVAKALKA